MNRFWRRHLILKWSKTSKRNVLSKRFNWNLSSYKWQGLIYISMLTSHDYVWFNPPLLERSRHTITYCTPSNTHTNNPQPLTSQTHFYTLLPPRCTTLWVQNLSFSHSLSLHVSVCLSPLFWLADSRHQQCVCAVSRPRHIRPPLLALDSRCQRPAIPQGPSVGDQDGLHTQMPYSKTAILPSCIPTYIFGNCLENILLLILYSNFMELTETSYNVNSKQSRFLNCDRDTHVTVMSHKLNLCHMNSCTKLISLLALVVAIMHIYYIATDILSI